MASPTLPLPLRAGPEDSKQGSHQFPSGSCLDPGAQVFPEVNVLLQDRPPTSVLLVWMRVAEGTGTPEGGVRAWPMGPGGGSLGGHVGGLASTSSGLGGEQPSSPCSLQAAPLRALGPPSLCDTAPLTTPNSHTMGVYVAWLQSPCSHEASQDTLTLQPKGSMHPPP